MVNTLFQQGHHFPHHIGEIRDSFWHT